MANNDYYRILNVSRNASEKDIKKAYKKLAKKYHPDFNQGKKDAENKFKDCSEAYQVLSDPEKKKQYDMFGKAAFEGNSGYGGRHQGTDGSRFYTRSSGPGTSGFGADLNFDEIFRGIFEGSGNGGSRAKGFNGGNPFGGSAFRFGGGMNPEPVRDVETDLTIGFDEAMRGGVHRFSLKRNNGATEQFENLSVKIPPGVNEGGRLRIPGKGEAGPEGRNGDLYVRIHVRPHKYFRREGNHLHLDLPLTISEAALGARVEVPTHSGTAVLKIKEGTQNGAVLRMKKKGVPNPKGGKQGDMYVHIQVKVPGSLDAETRKLMEALRELEVDPRANKF